MVGVAVYVTEVPAQTVEPGLAAMKTPGATDVVTVSVIELLLTDVEETQTALLVRTHVTTSPFAGLYT